MANDEAYWRQKAKDFLTEAKFEKGYCHLKFRDKSSGSHRYTQFGIVYPDNPCEIFLLGEKGQPSGDSKSFKSIDEMLDAGWDVD